MKVEKVDLSIERTIIIHMITSSKFLREIISAIHPNQFESFYAQIISEWILEYWGIYKESPGKHIRDIYAQKQKLIRNEDQLEMVSKFLLSISKEYEKMEALNVDFVLQTSVIYLKNRSLSLLQANLERAILEKNHVKGEQLIASYKRVDTTRYKGVSLLLDSSKIMDAFVEGDDTMFKFSGALGEVVGSFCRGDLVSFLGAAKRGKSWWLLYTALQAAARGFKVVFFNLEMIENQLLRRAWQALTRVPRYSKSIKIPYFESIRDDDYEGKGPYYTVKLRTEEKEAVDPALIKEQQKKIKKQFRSGDIRIIPLPSNSASVSDLENHLDNLYHYENFIADMVIVDYADLLMPDKQYGMERRHQLNGIWTDLRKIGQSRYVSVVTASQAGRMAFKKDAEETDIAEDIRKITHVGKMISINQTLEDRRNRVVRIKQVVERDEFCSVETALVLQCLDLGQVCLDSRFAKDVDNDYDGDEDSVSLEI